MKPRRRLLATTAVGAASIVLVVALPAVRFAYHAPVLHVVLETGEALIAALLAYLLHGRFRRERRLDQVALVLALTLLASANLALGAVVRSTFQAGSGAIALWAPLGVRLAGAGSLAAASLLSPVRLRRPARAEVLVFVFAGVVVCAVVGLVALSGPSVPPIEDAAASLRQAARPRLTGHPLAVALQVLTLSCYAVATLGFARRSATAEEDEELTGWLATGCLFAVFARIHYLLFPSLYSQWVYTGDVLRLGFYLVLLTGAAKEIQRYWSGLADKAVLEERGRIARDLHDGLAQELAFIGAQSRRLARSADPAIVQWVVAAADRALDESRRAISVLADTLPEPLEAAVTSAAEGVASRMGIRLDVEVEHGIQVAAATREALLRIVREAVTNAARHSGCGSVAVRLTGGDDVTVLVEDRGRGFDPAAVAAQGRFGLRSMSERAAAVGGTLTVASRPGQGTTVKATVPL